MALLELIANIRCPFLDTLMLGITTLGDETAFLVVALIIFWCVDKRQGYYILSVGFLGTILNQFMKLLFRVPRPWELDAGTSHQWKIKADAGEAAYIKKWDSLNPGGYSFPSGHSQSSVGTFGSVAALTKHKIIKWLCIAVCILVPFSRLYFGVHTPQDVLVGSGMALVMIFALKPVVLGKDGKYFPWFLLAMTVLSGAYLLYVQVFLSPEGLDVHSYEHGLQNAYTLTGALLGFVVVYPIEKRFIRYPEKAVWWAQLLKVILGLVLVLLIQGGMKTPLTLLFTELPGRLVRYFLMVVVAGAVWPLSFRWFASLGKKD